MHLPQQSFAFFLLLALGCATEAPSGLEVSDRILKGFRADIISYPYQVGLTMCWDQEGGGRLCALTCGGAIIADNFILTAAHCLIPYDSVKETYIPRPAEDIVVHANCSVLDYRANQGGQQAHVKKIYYHPNLDYLTHACYDYDMAILELTKPLTLGPGVQVIPLPTIVTKPKNKIRQYLPVNTTAHISGYGQREPKQLHAAEVKISDYDVCDSCYHDLMQHILLFIICVGEGKEEPGLFHGDFGGPLVVDGVLEGIGTCMVNNKNSKCPDAFAHIADKIYRSFIKEVTGI